MDITKIESLRLRSDDRCVVIMIEGSWVTTSEQLQDDACWYLHQLVEGTACGVIVKRTDTISFIRPGLNIWSNNREHLHEYLSEFPYHRDHPSSVGGCLRVVVGDSTAVWTYTNVDVMVRGELSLSIPDVFEYRDIRNTLRDTTTVSHKHIEDGVLYVGYTNGVELTRILRDDASIEDAIRLPWFDVSDKGYLTVR